MCFSVTVGVVRCEEKRGKRREEKRKGKKEEGKEKEESGKKEIAGDS
jgi:hypothetical protein